MISVFDDTSFLEHVHSAKQACSEGWFVRLAESADGGNTTYQRRNGVVCKLVNDEFVPVILGIDTLRSVTLR